MAYTIWQNWEQYPALAGRIGGVFISDFWKYLRCINEGIDARIGLDVGLCIGEILSLLIDTAF